MRPVNLIVSCTNRKKAVAPEALRLRSLRGATVSRRLKQWLRRLATEDVEPLRATDLYAGDHWQVVQRIPSEAANANLEVRLWVCSAGYGLIRRSEKIKPYAATFAPAHPDSVARLGSDSANGSALRAWWSGLAAYSTSKGSPRSVTELVAREPEVPLVVIASAPYLRAMAADLVAATGSLVSEEMLSILSIGTDAASLRDLRPHLLPASARFEALVGGTRAALNARVGRLLFQHLNSASRTSKAHLAATLDRLAADLPPLRRFDRRRLSDEDVHRFITKARRATPHVSKTRLLRQLRSSGAACEQSRFSTIFTQVLEGTDDAT